jgi:hypothetical protein
MQLKTILFAAALCLTAGLGQSVFGISNGGFRDEPHTPAKGTPERQAIMDAVREDYKKNNGVQVTFLVNYLKIHNGWCWTDLTPLGADSKPVAEGGTMLLHYEQDRWNLIDLSKVADDPDDPMASQDASPGFIRNLRKIYPDVPTDIFPRKKGSR